jgi:diguanylate cyclase (GGDEF)-like protein
MKFASSLRNRAAAPSPLEGSGAFRALQNETDLARLTRHEWWHWFFACTVTLLAAAALVLSFIPHLFRQHAHFYEIRADQAQWATAVLLVLFNARWVYHQWFVRRQRRLLTGADSSEPAARSASDLVADTNGTDPATGLCARASAEHHLGKEIARARRENTALSLATIHIDEFAELSSQYGKSAADAMLKELARRMKRAIRGSDFAVRLSAGDFLLVLPECTLGEVKLILNRLGTLEIGSSGDKNPVSVSTGWVDYQPGESPSELLKRASHILHLYENAAKSPLSTSLAS